MSFSKSLYNGLILPVMLGGFHVLAPFLPKVNSGLRGRQGLLDRARTFREKHSEKELLLFHCASAGEFESLRPLAREFDRDRFLLAVSYFSPSARELVADSGEFDFADYSPVDKSSEVRAYLDVLKPTAICITKHDVWPNFVWRAQELGIPSFLISGNFPASSMKFWLGAREFHRAIYSSLTRILTVSEDDSKRALRLSNKMNSIQTTGDTRYDRVLQRAQRNVDLPPELSAFAHSSRVLIVGSSHGDDENLIVPVLKPLLEQYPDFKVVLVPHDPSRRAAGRIQQHCREYAVAIGDLDHALESTVRVALVNRSGILADLYSLGEFAYVGGGFGKGVHSVLEPMAHGLPVVCGPNIQVSNEALQAQSCSLLKTVTGRQQFREQVDSWLENPVGHDTRMSDASKFVKERSGATGVIVKMILDAIHE